jgi:hypothetical protein
MVKRRQTFSPSCPKKGGKGGKSGRQTFSPSCPKKGGKGGKSGRQTFSPSCPKKGGKGGETGFTAFTAFFPASLKNVSIYTLDMRLISTSLHSSCHSAHRN